MSRFHKDCIDVRIVCIYAPARTYFSVKRSICHLRAIASELTAYAWIDGHLRVDGARHALGRHRQGQLVRRCAGHVPVIMILFQYLAAFFHLLTTRYLRDVVCAAGPAGFAAKYIMSVEGLSRKVDSLVTGCKPTNKLCGKRCGLAVGREPTRLQAYIGIPVKLA